MKGADNSVNRYNRVKTSRRKGVRLHADQLCGPLYKPSGEDKPLEAVVEYDPLSSLYLYDLYPLRRNLCVSGNKNEPEIQKVFKLHLYFPVHHATVDVSGCMAERI